MSACPFEIGQYAALLQGGGFVELPDWSRVTLTGTDRQAFLHNFCTNDVRRLSPGEGCEAFVTNVKGKTIGHGLVSCRKNELVLTTVPGQSASLVAHFERYIIREDVQVADTTSSCAYLLLAGSPPKVSAALDLAATMAPGHDWQRPLLNAAATFVDIRVHWIRWALLGARFCGLLELNPASVPRARQLFAERGFSNCGVAAFHALRIEAGMPLFGVDFDDRNLPQEVGRNEQAISFTKGCYLGQETVARIDALGHVNQQLAGVRFAGTAVPQSGAELTYAGGSAGRVTSATFSPQLQAPLALAMLRSACLAVGSRLESLLGPCEVIPLPVAATRWA
jgi:folate-binding protein YgfZ